MSLPYQYISHVQEFQDTENPYRTHFNHENIIVYQSKEEILLSDLNNISENVRCIVLGKKIVFAPSTIEP